MIIKTLKTPTALLAATLVGVGAIYSAPSFAANFGDMFSPGKWFGGGSDRDRYDDDYYGGPWGGGPWGGYGPGWGGYGPGWGSPYGYGAPGWGAPGYYGGAYAPPAAPPAAAPAPAPPPRSLYQKRPEQRGCKAARTAGGGKGFTRSERQDIRPGEGHQKGAGDCRRRHLRVGKKRWGTSNGRLKQADTP